MKILPLFALSVWCFLLGPTLAHAGESSPLVGSWIRPDGGYRLQVISVEKDGAAEVAYFNPMPIRVAKASVSTKDGLPALSVLFDDENYRGSKYDLVLKDGKLAGKYFQAGTGQTFDIFFDRAPEQ